MEQLGWGEISTGLILPLARLMLFVGLGLFVGILIETLNWTRFVAVLATPMARFGRLKRVAAASFSVAFFSGFTANNMLAESYDKGELSDRELIFSNLFNSFPAFCQHLPSLYGLLLGYFSATPKVGLMYAGLTLFAAFLRTCFIVLLGRLALSLPKTSIHNETTPAPQRKQPTSAPLQRAWQRFCKRIPKIFFITVPIYCTIFFARHYGLFLSIEKILSNNLQILNFLPPEAISIVAVQLLGEVHGGLALAAGLLSEGILTPAHVITALLLANILSSPMRAIRHQFPYYAGIFRPRMGLKLILFNQTLRAGSIAIVTLGYILFLSPS